MYVHTSQSQNLSTLIKRATYFSVSAAGIMIFIKLIAWFLTGSITVLASLFDSILDITASLLNMVAAHYALQPPDNEHRFGHGKAEDLATLSQSLFFGISGLIIIISSIKKLFNLSPLEGGYLGIYIMLLSIAINISLVMYQKHVIKHTNSSIIKADNFHYLTDLLTNLVTIAALILSSYFNINYADPILAILIAIYILCGSFNLLKKAFDNLMDHEMSLEDKDMIKNIIISNKDVKSFHDLKTRLSGNKAFIQFHLVHDDTIILKEAHLIADAIENEILAKIPNAEVIIHQDPESVEEEIKYKD